ncbi:MAG: Holliday junction resolvase RuvX [Anaerolineales bacterium]
MRILAIDPGEKRIGIAISDPTGTIANPLTMIKHVSRRRDKRRNETAAKIARLAEARECGKIVVGQALDWDGGETPSSRRARRLAGAIRARTNIPVELWDEYGSTQAAREARIAMGIKRKKRRGHIDELAATVILQSYLDESS